MASMSDREFREWQAFWKLHPFGQDIEDGRFARMMALFAATKTAKGKKLPVPNDFTLRNYLPEANEPPQTISEAFRALAGIN